MKILALADVEEPGLWDHWEPEKTRDVDLIVACGDLDRAYLEFLVTMSDKPLLYVPGNHDGAYPAHALPGCKNIDDELYVIDGLRIAGLGGSPRYGTGPHQYTERQMRARMRAMAPKIMLAGGVDILVTHAPARGVGDMPDVAHRGFECLHEFAQRWHPRYLLHGHVHKGYDAGFTRKRDMPCGTVAVNACGSVVLEIEPIEWNRRPLVDSLLNARCEDAGGCDGYPPVLPPVPPGLLPHARD